MIIYKIENKINGKIYIGQTVKSLSHRKNQHIKAALRGEPYLIQKAIRKYGAENFEWSIIQKCITMEHLNLAEQAYIELYKMKGFKLYNMTDGGKGNVGWNPTEETRKKIGMANSKRIITEETRIKLSQASSLKKHTEETKRKIGDIHKGKKISEEAKKKIGEANSKYIRDENYRRKMSEIKKGEIRSPETRLKMSEAKKLYWLNKKSGGK